MIHNPGYSSSGVNYRKKTPYTPTSSGGLPDSSHAVRYGGKAGLTTREFDRFIYICGAFCCGSLVLAFFTLKGMAFWTMSFTLLVCIGAFWFSSWLVHWIMSKDDGTVEMRNISDAIKEGAEGYLSVQYFTIFKMAIATSIILFIMYLYRPSVNKNVPKVVLAIVTVISFLSGAFASAIAGYSGVWASVRVNIRAAAAASKHDYGMCLLLCFRGGAVSSVLSAAMCISGISFLYIVSHIIFVSIGGIKETELPLLLGGYGFGASFVALFMQLGGGIYTKAADVGADMVGKIEQNIPEDDPRNPAVIADLVGDNVGDCAGSMADVFESIAGEMIGTMILGATLAEESGIEDPSMFVFFPLIIHSLDLIVSSVGIMATVPSGQEDPLRAMTRGMLVSLVLAIIGFFFVTRTMLSTPIAPNAWYHYCGCGIVGLLVSFCLIKITQYYTDYNYGPVKKIARASETGHGTNVIAGFGVGMESTAMPAIVICIGLYTSYSLGASSGLPRHIAGLFGTAVATMGMLCFAVFILSMNNFGPIADNAGGIVEMSDQPESVRVITDKLDAVGNVTKAACKGYAVGGSAMACFLLFQAYLDEISVLVKHKIESVDITKVEVMIGGMLGIAMIFLFVGWAVDAVGRTASQVVIEVRRQFRNMPGIMDRSQKPEYKKCVSIVTAAALREMVRPAVLALASPVLVGLLGRYIGSTKIPAEPMLGVEVLAAFLMFGTLTGLLMAIFLDNSGGAWDNAKKLLEAENKKGTLAHHAAVTGDTVGDPFKDTAGPSLHVIITTMSTTALVLGPIFVGSLPNVS